MTATRTQQGPRRTKEGFWKRPLDNQCLGHQFSWTSRHQNGARIKCLLCGLGAAQINKLELLQRVLAQPCKGHDLPQHFAQFWRAHPSHVMSVDGMFWRCDRCQAPQHTGQREVSKRLLKECPGVKPKVSPSKKKQTACNGAGTITVPLPGSRGVRVSCRKGTARPPKLLRSKVSS